MSTGPQARRELEALLRTAHQQGDVELVRTLDPSYEPDSGRAPALAHDGATPSSAAAALAMPDALISLVAQRGQSVLLKRLMTLTQEAQGATPHHAYHPPAASAPRVTRSAMTAPQRRGVLSLHASPRRLRRWFGGRPRGRRSDCARPRRRVERGPSPRAAARRRRPSPRAPRPCAAGRGDARAAYRRGRRGSGRASAATAVSRCSTAGARTRRRPPTLPSSTRLPSRTCGAPPTRDHRRRRLPRPPLGTRRQPTSDDHPRREDRRGCRPAAAPLVPAAHMLHGALLSGDDDHRRPEPTSGGSHGGYGGYASPPRRTAATTPLSSTAATPLGAAPRRPTR